PEVWAAKQGRLSMPLQRVVRSTVIDLPVARLWPVLRDFNSHADWHPAVAESYTEGRLSAEPVGGLRHSPIPLYRCVAALRLKPVTDGDRTFWQWQSTFATPAGREHELTEQVGCNVYEAGFEALRRYLGANRQNTMVVSPAWSD